MKPYEITIVTQNGQVKEVLVDLTNQLNVKANVINLDTKEGSEAYVAVKDNPNVRKID